MTAPGRALRRVVTALAAGAAVLAACAPAALAHGDANCTGKLAREGNTWNGSCFAPFQGFPVGVAGYFNADELEERSPLDAEIGVELWLLLADGTKKPMLVSCTYNDIGIVRCTNEYNPFGTPLDATEPVPDEIVGILCESESRSVGPTAARPGGSLACWSTDSGREDLENDHWFSDRGFEPYAPPPPASGGVDPFRTLSDTGVQSQILAVPDKQYATTSMVVSRRLGLVLRNLDANFHEVVARDDFRPDGSAPWCAVYPSGKCPLFWSLQAGTTGGLSIVRGLGDAEADRDYTFYCSIHPSMVGTITVAD